MANEIERKFAVVSDGFKAQAFEAVRIIQGYLCSDRERTVRVRVKGNKGFITVKGKSDDGGVSRFEWEKEISADEAVSLLNLSQPGKIDKTRYLVKNSDGIHVWEVDEFHGDNEGLVMAEIELSDPSDLFDKPEWIGKELTGDIRFYNSYLSKNPYKHWD